MYSSMSSITSNNILKRLIAFFKEHKAIYLNGTQRLFLSPDNGYLFTPADPYLISCGSIRSYDELKKGIVLNLINGSVIKLNFVG